MPIAKHKNPTATTMYKIIIYIHNAMLSDKIVCECAVARATAEENLLKILIREQQKEAEVKNKNDGVVVNGVQYGVLAI